MSTTQRTNRLQQVLIRGVLVVAPTILIGYITLRFLNFSYTAFSTGIFSQAAYFAVGLMLSFVLYYYGARWIITLLAVGLVYWIVEKLINRLPGEFDVFYATARFQLYSTLFLFGWVFGFLLVRVKGSYVFLFGVLVIITLVSISNTVNISLGYIVLHLLPVVVYGLYMLFVSPLLTEHIEINVKKSGKLALRFGLFVLLILLALVLTETLFTSNLQAVEKELAARGSKENKDGAKKDDNYDDRYGLMDKGDDGYRLKDTMRVNSKMSQSDRLMFCSKLDNYFPDGSPMPLYFVYHYLTKYDPIKESFTRDLNVPSFDEFDVDPAVLPMYYSYTDTSVFRKSMARKMRRVVDAQVYLSENTWKHSVLGPASVFSIQTIPVEKDFQKTFISAYKIQSYVSDLNNAYFVYNVSANPMLDGFQEQRHAELRSVQDYKNVNGKFLDYYTEYPTGGIYDSIAKLSNSLVAAGSTPVDKVLAVRDFFLRRNENGKRIFRYTLKPGAVDDPNIPSSKMLYNFLFKTHAGYCTYYAGASLFMLRSLGVPARFTTGFATVNRSDKNKGWYWFYASQAHAWTQVYFPGYGWLDFDMTIGNEDQQSAPKPDGTPPLPPPEPWLVLNVKTESVDGVARKLDGTFKELIYFNTPYALNKSVTRTIDASICRVLYDKKDTTFSAIRTGDSLIVVSYKEEARKIRPPRAGVSIDQQVQEFASPIIADEIHIRPREKEKKKDDTRPSPVKQGEKKITWQEVVVTVIKAVGVLLVLIFAMPFLYLVYCLLRIAFARNSEHKANHVYRAALYRFHMAGVERENETPQEYSRIKVDPFLASGFEEFMRMYLRLKYANQGLRPGDKEIINRFAAAVGPSIRKKNGILRTVLSYCNILRAARYIQQPENTNNETPSL